VPWCVPQAAGFRGSPVQIKDLKKLFDSARRAGATHTTTPVDLRPVDLLRRVFLIVRSGRTFFMMPVLRFENVIWRLDLSSMNWVETRRVPAFFSSPLSSSSDAGGMRPATRVAPPPHVPSHRPTWRWPIVSAATNVRSGSCRCGASGAVQSGPRRHSATPPPRKPQTPHRVQKTPPLTVSRAAFSGRHGLSPTPFEPRFWPAPSRSEPEFPT